MSYVKVLVRAEACTEALSAMENRHVQRLEDLRDMIAEHVETTPTSGGKFLDVFRSQTFTIMPTVISPDKEKASEFVGYDGGDNFEVTLTIITQGVIFENCTEDEVAEVLNTLGSADKAENFPGLSWKYFEESDLPK